MSHQAKTNTIERLIGAAKNIIYRAGRVVPLLALLLSSLCGVNAHAAYHMVTPGGSGNHSGSDWNNALVGNNVLNGGTLTRGDVYCIGGGTYTNWVLSQSDSSTAVIELRAATPSDLNCGSVVAGWGPSVDTRQTPAVVTRGSLPIDTFNTVISIQSDYWLINGVTSNGPKTGFGLKCDISWPNYVAVCIRGDARKSVTIQYMEFIGGGLHEDAAETVSASLVSRNGNFSTLTISPNCSAGQRCIMPWFNNQLVTISGVVDSSFNCTKCQISGVNGNAFNYLNPGNNGSSSGGTVAGIESSTEEQIRFLGIHGGTQTDSIDISHCYLHNSMNSPIQLQDITNSNIHHNVFGAFSGNPTNHSNAISMDATSSLSIYRNVFEDCESTACIATGVNHLTDSSLAIYDNIFMMHSGNPFHQYGAGNGAFSVTTSSGQTGLTINDNTIINLGAGTGRFEMGFLVGGTNTGCAIRNNLWYGNNLGTVTNSMTSCTEDHNSALYTPSGVALKGASDVVTPGAGTNPFANWQGSCSANPGDLPVCTGEDYALALENANWSNRISLTLPFDTDFAGLLFTTDRGAFQNTGASGTRPQAPVLSLLSVN